MKVSISIMHTPRDPKRRSQIRDLSSQLQKVGASFEIVEDRHQEGVWPTARRAWLTAARRSTNAVVLQDDIELVPGFYGYLVDAINSRPYDVLSLFSMRKAIREAHEKGLSWIYGQSVSSALGLVLPSTDVYPFIKFCDRFIKADYKHDDARLALYLLTKGLYVFYTVPCLVEHTLPEESLVGHPGTIGGRPRTAALFLPDYTDYQFNNHEAEWDGVNASIDNYKKALKDEYYQYHTKGNTGARSSET